MTVQTEAQAERARAFSPRPSRAGHRDSSGRRVYELLRMRIRSGEVDPDELFIDTTLVRSFNATRHAVRRALQSLADEGLLQRSPRSGTRLSGHITNAPLFGELHPQTGDEAEPNVQGGRLVVRPTQRAVATATELVASRLRLPVGTRLAVLEQELYVDGESVGVRSIYFAPHPDAETVVGLADGGDHDPVSFEEFFGRVYGKPVGRSKITVEAVPAIAGEHDSLEVVPGTPLLLRTMLTWDASRRPICISFTHLRGDRMALCGWIDQTDDRPEEG